MYSALKEMSQARYRIEEEGTNGYSVLRFGMTREECQDAWEYYKIYCDNTGIEKKSQKKLIECLCNEYDDYKMGKTNKGFKCIKWKNLEELGIVQTN